MNSISKQYVTFEITYKRIVNKDEDTESSTSSEICFPQTPVSPDCKLVTFGRNRGETYKNVYDKDKSYVQWVLGLKNCTGKMLDLQTYFVARKQPIECPGCGKLYKSKPLLHNHKTLGRCKGLKHKSLESCKGLKQTL